ncbi:Ger(x)C family spore germination protein [Priestia megaterium]|nr:Ger(x)C family spore germination protein [Priestia megaterium]
MLKKWSLLFSCILLLTSCADREIIDEIQVVSVLGYDYDPDTDNVRGTILYPIFKFGPTEEPSIIAAKAKSPFDIPIHLNNKSSLTIAFGQLRSVLIGQDFAEHGIEDLVNTLARNPDLGRTLKVAMTDGNAHEMLSSVTRKKIKDYQFISNLIDQNIKSENLPRTNLQTFLFSFFSDDRDSFLPILTQEKDAIKLKGLALFKKEKYMTSIGMKETFLMKLLIDGTEHGRYSMKIEHSGHEGEVVLQNIRTKTNYELKGKKQDPIIIAHLKVNGLVKEFPEWLTLTNPAHVKILEEELTATLEKNSDEFIQKLQNLEVDPICFTDYVRSRTRNFDSEAFKANYPTMDIRVKADVELIQTGISE